MSMNQLWRRPPEMKAQCCPGAWRQLTSEDSMIPMRGKRMTGSRAVTARGMHSVHQYMAIRMMAKPHFASCNTNPTLCQKQRLHMSLRRHRGGKPHRNLISSQLRVIWFMKGALCHSSCLYVTAKHFDEFHRAASGLLLRGFMILLVHPVHFKWKYMSYCGFPFEQT